MKTTVVTSLLLLALFCTPANGTNLVAFEITATVDLVSDPLGVLSGSIAVNDTLTGILQYDLDLVDGRADANLGSYLAVPLVDNFINGTNGATGNFETTVSLEITVGDDFGSDQINFSASGDTIPSAIAVSGIDFVEIDIILQDTDETAFSDDSLPATLDLADFEEASLSFLAGGSSSSSLASFVQATITSITPTTPVPEPSTLLLGAMAGLGMLARRRKRK